ncbi:CPBP family glutamic-type intramembrane protease [Buttiauxella sp. WJP83]|uniref:CPBP family intramembrane glutamic endopeptidase n=1 Tax=Buttiauxella sp. WJP83 TaxID=2986951 RepID=UPI0022DE7926|nr:CPBP family glutamic-type intramembrane protease [Buttiauxella sp. WJP83]WBM72669.1 CPBP family glutamic-type intramembrane protease [Buttiauxella sp. WJP83]
MYTKDMSDFSHGYFTSSIFLTIFILSVAITSIPIYIMGYSGIESSLYVMFFAELQLAIVSYSVFFRRLSEFHLSGFSARQFFSALTIIIALQVCYMMLQDGSGINLGFLPVVIMVIVIPFFEEVFYRGCLFGFICSIYKKDLILPAVLSSLIFSIMHMQFTSIIEYALIFAVGLILSYARVITKGLLLPMALHSTMNAFVLTANFFV